MPLAGHVKPDLRLPLSVEREFTDYLDCGILARGFARVRCGDCGNELLVGFSGKRRGAIAKTTLRIRAAPPWVRFCVL